MAEITNFLEKIADRQSSFVLFQDRVYDISEHSDAFRDSLRFGDMAFSLVPSLTYSEFESLDERIQGKKIEKYCVDYVRNAINAELKSESEIQREKDRINILKFIVNELTPYFLSKKYQSEDLLIDLGEASEETKIDPLELARKDISDKLTKDFNIKEIEAQEDPVIRLKESVLRKERLRQTEDSIFRKDDEEYKAAGLISSDLGNILGNRSFYILNGEALGLKPAEEIPKSVFAFTLGGKTYVPSIDNKIDLERISKELTDRKKLKWRITALERSQDVFETFREEIKKFEVNETQMHELAKLERYDFGECGFAIIDGNHYFYTNVPRFATQDGRNGEVFWPYETTRVGMKIGWSDGRAYASNTRVLDKQKNHPCLKGRDSDQTLYDICNLSRSDSDYDNSITEMVRRLNDGIKVIMEPLNESSLKRHEDGGRHSYFGNYLEDILKQGSLTRDQARDNGYMLVEVISKTVG